jgi:hypothetical protein
MVEIDQRAIDEAAREGESMRTRDLFDIVERYHDDKPGVPRDTLEAYARELNSKRDFGLDVETFLGLVDERRTDSDTWAGNDVFYGLDGDRLSQYPASWHEALHGSTDPVEYLRFFRDEAPAFLDDHRGSKPGVQKDTLVRIMRVVGGTDQQTAVGELEAARDDGFVEESADQHPQTGVFLADDTEDRAV